MTTFVHEEVIINGGDDPPDGYVYCIDIYTGSQWGAGTDSNVLVTIYGEKGDTGQRQLDNDGNNFERDSHDNFKIVHHGDYIGRVNKIKIGHDNSGIGPAWFLNKVTIEDAKTNEVFEFPCEEWFGDDSGGLLSRDLDYTNVTLKKPSTEKVNKYTIHICTGTEWGAGTDANVHVTIYGTKGVSEDYRFENKGSSTFVGGSKDSFQVETKHSLGTIYKVRVGHDNTGWGPGWFLDKIEVEDRSNGEIIEFLCGKWLATDSEDGLIRRDLMRENFVEDSESTLEEVTYKVNIHTGDVFGAGTDANILFTLFGTDGESQQQTFENEGSTTFENGMIDTVEFKCPYLGTLTKARIGHDNTGWGPAWFLNKVTVEDPKTGEKALFPCNRWLATNADDGMIERELTREGYFGEIIIEGLPDDLKGEPLGLETGDLKDDCVTASSSADDTPPSNARLNNQSGWCAKEPEGCWLQVDLERIHCVTSVATQGNPGGNSDYVKKFKLQYSQDGLNWTYHEENGNQLFDANVDHCTIKTVKLQKYIVARYVRFCPVEWYCWPCLRVEVYGVPLKEGESEVKTVSYVTEEVRVTTETEENESAPPDEKERAEDAIQLILSQTGDKRKDSKDQKQKIEEEMKQLEQEKKERGKKREKEIKRLEEEAKKREEEEERKREEDREKKRKEEEERKRKVELEVLKIEQEHRARLEELDKLMKEEENRQRKQIEEKKKADEEELKRLEDERKKIEDEEKRLEEGRRLHEIALTTKTIGTKDTQEKTVTVTTTTVSTTTDDNDEEETATVDSDERETVTVTTTQDGDGGKIVTTITTVTTMTDHNESDDQVLTTATTNGDNEVTTSATIDDDETTVTTTHSKDVENGEVITVTKTTQVVAESSLDDERSDIDFVVEEKPEDGYVFVKHENEEERKERLHDEEARGRFEKMRRMKEEEDKRQKEVKELNMIERRMKEDEEERKKKIEAKRIKEQQEKEREEQEREEKVKKDEKAKRKAEKEKKKMLKGQVIPSDSLSSLSSSSSSSSSEEEGKTAVSTIDKTPFRAPIASVDDEGEDEITKLVTYRTTTKTTTRIVSWPGTYYFKPIEPGERQQDLPEDVGLLFGFDDVKPYKGKASSDHLKPEDAAIRSARESSFTCKFYDGGPKPVWYGGLDTESTLSASAIRDEDVDRLVEWEKAGNVGWKRAKKSRHYEIWKRKAHEGGPPITKAVITLDDIPYASAIKILSDWKSRNEWDKTFDKVDVLETGNTSTVVHCPVKKREYALAVQDRQDSDEPFYASAWRNTTHPKQDLTKGKRLKLYYLVAGLVIRPINDGSQSSKLTLICQVKGSVPSKVKSTFLAAKPAKWITELKKYHKKISQDSAVKEE